MVKKAKKRKVVENRKAPAEGSASPKEGIVMHAGVSRNELMLKAKEQGIKNFRILNKEELGSVLADGVTQEQIDKIVVEAVARWKSGWGRRKNEN